MSSMLIRGRGSVITVRVTSKDMDVSIGLESIEDMEVLDKVVAKVRNQLARGARMETSLDQACAAFVEPRAGYSTSPDLLCATCKRPRAAHDSPQ